MHAIPVASLPLGFTSKGRLPTSRNLLSIGLAFISTVALDACVCLAGSGSVSGREPELWTTGGYSVVVARVGDDPVGHTDDRSYTIVSIEPLAVIAELA